MIKTYKGWKGSLTSYLQIGDLVDFQMYNYFINVLPPATFRSNLVQIGEPYSISAENKETFMTLKLTEDGWKYAGTCHQGCNINQPSIY